MDYPRYCALATKALADGAVYDWPTILWDVSGDCEKPPERFFKSQRPKSFLPTVVGHEFGWYLVPTRLPELQSGQLLFMTITVRCRQCASCLKARARHWAARAFSETKISTRTWFCTYTVSPEHRMRVRLLARRKYNSEDFVSCTKILSEFFTKYLKRVRKESGVKFRYLLAVEAHEDGFPHLHALIHENGFEVSKRCLQGQWPYGFSSVKLATPETARYVTKYISKQARSRVRASLHYGQVLTLMTASCHSPPKEVDVIHDLLPVKNIF